MLEVQGASIIIHPPKSCRPTRPSSVRSIRQITVAGSGRSAARALSSGAAKPAKLSSPKRAQSIASVPKSSNVKTPSKQNEHFNLCLTSLAGEELASIPNARTTWTCRDVATQLAKTMPLQNEGEKYQFVCAGDVLKPGVPLKECISFMISFIESQGRVELTTLVVPKRSKPDPQTKANLKRFLAGKYPDYKDLVTGVDGRITYEVCLRQCGSEQDWITKYRITESGCFFVTSYGEYEGCSYALQLKALYHSVQENPGKHTLEDMTRAFESLGTAMALSVDEIERVRAYMESHNLDTISFVQFKQFAQMRKAEMRLT